MKLLKTTIIIWSNPEYTDPEQFELSALAREAEEGLSYCSKYNTVLVGKAEDDPDWDGTEFFDEEAGN
jgi:hypothetical protein